MISDSKICQDKLPNISIFYSADMHPDFISARPSNSILRSGEEFREMLPAHEIVRLPEKRPQDQEG
jgi:hypothetical protein